MLMVLNIVAVHNTKKKCINKIVAKNEKGNKQILAICKLRSDLSADSSVKTKAVLSLEKRRISLFIAV